MSTYEQGRRADSLMYKSLEARFTALSASQQREVVSGIVWSMHTENLINFGQAEEIDFQIQNAGLVPLCSEVKVYDPNTPQLSFSSQNVENQFGIIRALLLNRETGSQAESLNVNQRVFEYKVGLGWLLHLHYRNASKPKREYLREWIRHIIEYPQAYTESRAQRLERQEREDAERMLMLNRNVKARRKILLWKI